MNIMAKRNKEISPRESFFNPLESDNELFGPEI
jgi:hypothetical protein